MILLATRAKSSIRSKDCAFVDRYIINTPETLVSLDFLYKILLFLIALFLSLFMIIRSNAVTLSLNSFNSSNHPCYYHFSTQSPSACENTNSCACMYEACSPHSCRSSSIANRCTSLQCAVHCIINSIIYIYNRLFLITCIFHMNCKSKFVIEIKWYLKLTVQIFLTVMGNIQEWRFFHSNITL